MRCDLKDQLILCVIDVTVFLSIPLLHSKLMALSVAESGCGHCRHLYFYGQVIITITIIIIVTPLLLSLLLL